jgi:hypothetical protein
MSEAKIKQVYSQLGLETGAGRCVNAQRNVKVGSGNKVLTCIQRARDTKADLNTGYPS